MVNLGQTVVIFHRQQLTDSQKLLPNGEKLPPDGINFYLMLKTTAGNEICCGWLYCDVTPNF